MFSSLVIPILNAFKVSNPAAPESLNTAIHKDNHPGKMSTIAINLIINEKSIFCLMLFSGCTTHGNL